MPNYILSLGSCHPMAQIYLLKAEKLIGEISELIIRAKSSLFLNSSINMKNNYLFYNSALSIFTYREPIMLYRELRAIEFFFGRLRPGQNSPRTIDIDILLGPKYSSKKFNFAIPHKDTYARDFCILATQELVAKILDPESILLKKAQFNIKPRAIIRKNRVQL